MNTPKRVKEAGVLSKAYNIWAGQRKSLQSHLSRQQNTKYNRKVMFCAA
jgi:hypothetical protein